MSENPENSPEATAPYAVGEELVVVPTSEGPDERWLPERFTGTVVSSRVDAAGARVYEMRLDDEAFARFGMPRADFDEHELQRPS